MINWNKINEAMPDSGRRVIIKLSDGRICSCKTNTGDLEIEHVDNMDMLAYMLSGDRLWAYCD